MRVILTARSGRGAAVSFGYGRRSVDISSGSKVGTEYPVLVCPFGSPRVYLWLNPRRQIPVLKWLSPLPPKSSLAHRLKYTIDRLITYA